MLLNILKTIPRDGRIVARHLKTMLELRTLEKNGGSIGKVFDEYAKRNPNKAAILFKDEIWTFKQVYETSNRIGNLFVQAGLKKADIVSLFMENRPEYICTWLGLCKIGVVTALVNFNLRSAPLKHSFDLSNGKAIICGYELADAFNDVYKDMPQNIPIFASGKGDRDMLKSAFDLDKEIVSHSASTPIEQGNTGFLDELFYMYTSGTTGLPKAAVIKQFRFIMAAVAGKNANKLREDDIIYATLPLYHTSSGIVGVSQTLVNGATLALREKFSASNFWTDCIKYKATAAQYMGETMRYLLRQPPQPEDRLHNVRIMFGNGLRAEIWEEFVTRFGIKQISEIYGATEGNVSTANYENKIGACGFIPILLKNLFPMSIVKLDDNNEPMRDPKSGLLIHCKPGEVGELVGKIEKNHPFRDFKGYASDKAANSKKILYDVFKKGDSAFRTGDLFMKDELGYLYFKDRMGDTFRWKGENVSSTLVEYVISNLTSKKLDVIVFPVKSLPNTDGQPGMAVVADEDNSLNLDDLSMKMKKCLASYAIPLFLRIVKQIEMTGNKKLISAGNSIPRGYKSINLSGTHKMKKTDLQKEGICNNNEINEGVYFWSSKAGHYVPLNTDLYKNIVSGNMKL